jgi:hypothetical protein
LEWSLRHELVHLERGDARVAALQAAMTALLWFHPVAWWLSGHLDWLREASCDAVVVARSGRRKSYALALLSYASAACGRAFGPSAGLAGPVLLPWFNSTSRFRRRVELLARVRAAPAAWKQAARLAAGGGVLAAVVVGQLALAGTLGATPALAAVELEETRLVHASAVGRVELRLTGRVTLQDGLEEIRDIGPGGSLILEERGPGRVRRVRVSANGGAGRTYSYSESGEPRPFDPEAVAWYRRMVRTFPSLAPGR